MEGNIIEEANSNFFPAKPPDTELYTIPSYSSWFSWERIHETERNSLKEFFDGFSISKNPKIYKEYRDFIISKYREDPSRRLTFTEIRKSLIGDVSLIHKVFLFLEKWGLINYGAPKAPERFEGNRKEENVRVEEGAPNGVRVVAIPHASKPVPLVPFDVGGDGEVMEHGFRLPPLASYSDVFAGAQMGLKGSGCANCGGVCCSGCSESNKKESSVTCLKGTQNETNGEGKAEDGSKPKDCKESSDKYGADWSDAETLLLLESVLKHGDNWDLISQDVQTKNKSECISRLIQLPFGDLMSTFNRNGDYRISNGNTSNIKQLQSTSVEPQAPIQEADLPNEQINETEQTGNREMENPPLKRRCIDPLANADDSLMKQVALLCTVVSPHVAAAAAEAAIAALCEENSHARVIFEGEEDNLTNEFKSPTSNNEAERIPQVEKADMVERHIQPETHEGSTEQNSVSLILRIRTAIATALGAAAAHAKLLADQEDREVEHLVATVIETQLKKINCKIKHFEELQLIKEKEYAQVQELKKSIIKERIDVLQQVFRTGVSRWRDHSSVKPFTGSLS